MFQLFWTPANPIPEIMWLNYLGKTAIPSIPEHITSSDNDTVPANALSFSTTCAPAPHVPETTMTTILPLGTPKVTNHAVFHTTMNGPFPTSVANENYCPFHDSGPNHTMHVTTAESAHADPENSMDPDPDKKPAAKGSKPCHVYSKRKA